MSFVVTDMISDMKSELDTIGQRVSNNDFFLAINNANKYFSAGNYFMPTRQREADLVMFDGVYEYALPSDFSYIIEPKRPYDLHSPRFGHTNERSLVHWLYGKQTAIKWARETAYLVIKNDSLTAKQQVNDFESLTDNGTLAISGDGSALAVDQTVYTQGLNSVSFTVTASGGSTTITITGMNQMDLTDVLSKGRFFVDLQCPSANTTALTSVVLRIGNDASNYYSMTATTRHRGDTILGGWGLLSFDATGKTTTGTVTDTEIDYAVLIITHGTSGVNGTYRMDNLFGALGSYYQLPYYSLNNVKNDAGTYQEKVTATGDTVLTPPDFAEAIKYKAMVELAAGKFQDEAKALRFAGELKVKENGLKSLYPRQQSLHQTTWYKKTSRF